MLLDQSVRSNPLLEAIQSFIPFFRLKGFKQNMFPIFLRTVCVFKDQDFTDPKITQIR